MQTGPDNSLEAFTTSRLIPLNKNPELRPIGVGEVFCQKAGKFLMHDAKKDVQDAAGAMQVCAGEDAGTKEAIHPMHHFFKVMKLELSPYSI